MASSSSELLRAVREAEDIAQKTGQPLSTAHLLLALFTFPNRAQLLLKERNIDEDRILAQMEELSVEPPAAFKRLKERALEIAQGVGADEADCLHLLIALLRVRESVAYELLERTGVALTALRNVVVSYVTNRLPRRFLQVPSPEPFDACIRSESASCVRGDPSSARPGRPSPVRSVEALTSSLTSPVAPKRAPLPSLEDTPRQEKTASGTASERFLLDPSTYPLLAEIGRNLCADAESGRIDDVVGRGRELSQVIDVLGRRRANNPCLVGPPGVGKTAIVEGLALAIVRGGDQVTHLEGKLIVEVPVGAMVSGTSLRGALSERLTQLQHEVKHAAGRVIVFVDELHTLIGAGSSGEGAQDVSNELKSALARGEFPCIGATTDAEYKKYVEQDPALERRFTAIEVKEPSVDEAILMLEGAIAPYAEHHGVTYSVEAIQAACQWSHKFIAERRLPDKAFSIIDFAGSRARRRGLALVGRNEIAEIVSELTGVPKERFGEGDNDRLARAELELGKRFVGQHAAVSRVAESLRRGLAGFSRQRPVASLLFLGPTGVGKTELAKVLAEFLFGRKDAMIRVDLSEYVEAHSVARLVGSPPGYVGFGDGGQLTEAVRKRPFQVVLFDEFEKGHPEVRNLLLQILDDGRLTDSKGRTVRFVDTVVIMTSNAGCDALHRAAPRIGFDQESSVSGTRLEQTVLDAAKQSFPLELWNRIDDKIVFHPLGVSDLERVAELILAELSETAFAEREVSITFSPASVSALARLGHDPALGARPLRQAIEHLIEVPLAEQILRGELGAGDCARLEHRGGSFVFAKVARSQALGA